MENHFHIQMLFGFWAVGSGVGGKNAGNAAPPLFSIGGSLPRYAWTLLLSFSSNYVAIIVFKILSLVCVHLFSNWFCLWLLLIIWQNSYNFQFIISFSLYVCTCKSFKTKHKTLKNTSNLCLSHRQSPLLRSVPTSHFRTGVTGPWLQDGRWD